MITKSPTPLAWSEQAEAEQMCMAGLREREPHQRRSPNLCDSCAPWLAAMARDNTAGVQAAAPAHLRRSKATRAESGVIMN